MKWLLNELPHAIFHVEKGILFNTKQLLIRPGYAIRNFLVGKRKPFFNPLTYLALMILMNYLVMKLVNFHTYDERELLLLKPDDANAYKEYDSTNWWIMEHAYWYMLIAVPVIGIFLFLWFNLLGRKFNLAESIIIALFTIALMTLIQTIMYLITGWIHVGSFARAVENADMYFLLPVFYAIALYQLYDPVRSKMIIAVLMLLAGEIIMQLLWKSAEWMVYLYHLIA
jgi:hypothetical protein